jgi:transcriptional regulator with XRE-family HTH domain
MEKSNNTTEGVESPLLVEGMSALDVLLARLSLTQEQFCEELGFHRSSYQRWKTGGLVTSLNHVQAKKLDLLLRRVGLSIQDLPDDVHPYSPSKSA